MNKEVINDLYNRLYVVEQRVSNLENTPLPFKDNVKETWFAYQNKKNQKWLKIERHFNQYSEKYEYSHDTYGSFDRSVLYSARNIIEEDFARVNLENREDWQLMEIVIGYNISVAK